MNGEKAREFWITRHPDSCDMDKLTHIVLFEKYYEDSLHVISYSAYEEMKAEKERMDMDAGTYCMYLEETKANLNIAIAALEKIATETSCIQRDPSVCCSFVAKLALERIK